MADSRVKRYSRSPSPWEEEKVRSRSRLRSRSQSRSWSRPRGRSRSRSRSRSQGRVEPSNPGTTLYVTGLSTRVTQRDLEEHFSKEGKSRRKRPRTPTPGHYLGLKNARGDGFRGDRGGDRGRYRGREDYGRLEDYGYRRSPPRRLPYRDYSPRRSPYGGRSRRERSRSFSPYERKYGGGGR